MKGTVLSGSRLHRRSNRAFSFIAVQLCFGFVPSDFTALLLVDGERASFIKAKKGRPML